MSGDHNMNSTADPYPLSKANQAIAAAVAKKMMKAAGRVQPEILAGAALLVIQLVCFVQDAKKGKS